MFPPQKDPFPQLVTPPSTITIHRSPSSCSRQNYNLSSLCETINHQFLIILLLLHRFDSFSSCTLNRHCRYLPGITAFTSQEGGEDKTARRLIVTVSPPCWSFCLSFCHSVSRVCLTLGPQVPLSSLWLSLPNGLIFTSCFCLAVPFMWDALSLIISFRSL